MRRTFQNMDACSTIFRSATRFLLLLSTIAGLAVAQHPTLDSLRAALPGTSGKARLAILFRLANGLEDINPKEAIAHGAEGIELAIALGDSASLATLYSSAAYCYSTIGEFTTAIEFGNRSLGVATALQDKKLIASANSTLGIASVYIGQYSYALEHHLIALRLREELGLVDAQARTLNNIGLVYHNLGQYDNAITYYNRAIERRGFPTDSVRVIRFLHNIGFSEFKRGHLDEAERLHTLALRISERIKYEGDVAYALFNLGLIATERKEYAAALRQLERARSLYRGLSRKHGIVQTSNAIGIVQLHLKRQDRAIEAFKEAAAIAKTTRVPDQLVVSYDQLHRIYAARGDLKRSFEYFKQYAAAKDSVFNTKESERLASLAVSLERLKFQREVDSLNQQQQLATLTLEKSRIQTNLLLVGAVSLLVIVGALYRANRLTKRSKELVERKNAELGRLNTELQTSINEVKTLSGLLPICSGCKKIRNDRGYWEQLESYIMTHSEAEFTHGLCPDCLAKFYPEYIKRKDAADV
ncbi:MAG: tetratricopeptide repeat protein [Bacteroidetes bacterium]|nr:tetratricopeptide repeat protein [Bacteroidota bacterium]